MKIKTLKQGKFLFTILLIGLFQNIGFGCFCAYEPVFCKAISETHTIIRAVVLDHPDPFLMEVEVLDNIHQSVEGNSILVYGNNGASCAEYLGQFNEADTLILALSYEQTYYLDTTTWFLQGLCGLNFLRYENGLVLGQITEELTEDSYENFIEGYSDCIELINSTEPELEKNEFVVSPNPFSDNLQISSDSNQPYDIEIYDAAGRLVYRQLSVTENIYGVDTSNFNKELYLVVAKTEEKTITNKVLHI